MDLQQGRIDAISTDSSILLGFQAQDPNTKLVGSSLADVPYGMEIDKAHPEFVRFVNGVLAEAPRQWHLEPALLPLAPPVRCDAGSSPTPLRRLR